MAISKELYDALSNPMDLPPEFKSWLVKYLEVHPPQIPANGLLGYQPGTKTTIGLFGAGPPASAKDGEFWVGTNVDANGTRWMFQYNASSKGTYPWEFVGGSPINRHIYSFPNFTNGAWSIFGGLVWTPPIPGNYLAWGSWAGTSPVAGGSNTYHAGVMVNTGSGYTAPRIHNAIQTPAAVNAEFEVVAPMQGQNVTSSQQIALGYKSSNTIPSVFSNAQIIIVPRTVGRN